MAHESDPPLGFTWRAKRVRTGLPDPVRPPPAAEPRALKPESEPAALDATSPMASRGLLALCEAANSAGHGEDGPSSTSTVSAPRLATAISGPDPIIARSSATWAAGAPAPAAGAGPATPTSRDLGGLGSSIPIKKKTAAYIGVRRRPWGSYAAEIRNQITGAREWLGTFETAEEAAVVYDIRKRQIKGEATKCNFPPLRTDGKLVRREICPHGQGSPERLTLLIPADWAAQVGLLSRHTPLGTLDSGLQTVKQPSVGSLDSSPFSAFSPVSAPPSASPPGLGAYRPAAEAT